MRWAELTALQRDLIVTVGIVNRDDSRTASGSVVIEELERRFNHQKTRVSCYTALNELRDAGLLSQTRTDDDGRQKLHELTPESVRIMDSHREVLDDSLNTVMLA